MRFLIDECTGPRVASWLREQGHDVVSVYESCRGASDEAILQRATTEGRVLITYDKDFGEMVFREKQAHQGIILLRIERLGTTHKIDVLRQIIERYGEQLLKMFIVATSHQVRIVGSS